MHRHWSGSISMRVNFDSGDKTCTSVLGYGLVYGFYFTQVSVYFIDR